jgi:hypothetical protein
MSSFRCSNGHLVTLAFEEGQLNRACPDCGVEVYKFRDICTPEDSPIPEHQAQPFEHGSWLRRQAGRAGIAAGSIAILAGVAAWALREPPSKPVAVSAGSIVPVINPTPSITLAPASNVPTQDKTPLIGAVAITQFSAVPTDAGSVRVTFQLTNTGRASAEYPALAIHWPGAEHADTVIASSAYSHPPLPFKATEVALELSRPEGATGIEVKLSN